jgi:transposase-like protein
LPDNDFEDGVEFIDNLIIFAYNVSMILHKTFNRPPEEKIRIAEKYLSTDQSLRKTANECGVSYKTLWFWVKRYKEGGIEHFRRKDSSRRRLSKEIERKVMFLKEQKPWLSIRKARRLLIRNNIKISNKGIWTIWHRHRLINRNKHDLLDLFADQTPEMISAVKTASEYVNKEKYREAAKTLNAFPSLCPCEILRKIPTRFLNVRRRLECLAFEHGRISYNEFSKKARQLGRLLEKKGYLYSSIIANFLEVDALLWLGIPYENIRILKHIAKKSQNICDSVIRLRLYTYQASSYLQMMHVDKAFRIIKKCYRLINHLPFCNYWELFGGTLTHAGEYNKAFRLYKRAFEKQSEPNRHTRLGLKMAFCGYSMSGDYSGCRKVLKEISTTKSIADLGATYSIIRAGLSFGRGDLKSSSDFFVESLRIASKGKLHNRIFATSLGLASVAMALSERIDAKVLLRKYLPLMKKHRMKNELLILKYLSNLTRKIPEEFMLMPPLHLLVLLQQAGTTMKIGDYRNAFDFAQRKGLLGLFHRWIVFFPEPVQRMLEKGKRTGLPKPILKFPIFNQKIPVYHMKFLGRFVIVKHQQYLKKRVTPKEKAFLIHLALKADAPGKSILVSELYQNFWQRSKNQANLLAHLPVRLKKKLRLPGHSMVISSRSGESRFINGGAYFTTDYSEFEALLIQARALERAGEWGFAKKEYLRAFKLFRGAPFRKMYDPWSEHMRRVILNKLENEALHFAKSCLEYDNEIRQKKRRTPSAKCRGGNMADARKVLEKVAKIIPQSEESAKILQTLCP